MTIRVTHNHNLLFPSKVKLVTKFPDPHLHKIFTTKLDNQIFQFETMIKQLGDKATDYNLKLLNCLKYQKSLCDRPYGGYGTYKTKTIKTVTDYYAESKRLMFEFDHHTRSVYISSDLDQSLWYSMETRQ